MIWRITTPENDEHYLVGSIHTLKADDFPLAKVYNQSFKKAQRFVFETDINAAGTQLPALQRKLGFLPDGETLQGTLPESTYQILEDEFNEMGNPETQFQQMRPWRVFLTSPTQNPSLLHSSDD